MILYAPRMSAADRPSGKIFRWKHCETQDEQSKAWLYFTNLHLSFHSNLFLTHVTNVGENKNKRFMVLDTAEHCPPPVCHQLVLIYSLRYKTNS